MLKNLFFVRLKLIVFAVNPLNFRESYVLLKHNRKFDELPEITLQENVSFLTLVCNEIKEIFNTTGNWKELTPSPIGIPHENLDKNELILSYVLYLPKKTAEIEGFTWMRIDKLKAYNLEEYTENMITIAGLEGGKYVV